MDIKNNPLEKPVIDSIYNGCNGWVAEYRMRRFAKPFMLVRIQPQPPVSPARIDCCPRLYSINYQLPDDIGMCQYFLDFRLDGGTCSTGQGRVVPG